MASTEAPGIVITITQQLIPPPSNHLEETVYSVYFIILDVAGVSAEAGDLVLLSKKNSVAIFTYARFITLVG